LPSFPSCRLSKALLAAGSRLLILLFFASNSPANSFLFFVAALSSSLSCFSGGILVTFATVGAGLVEAEDGARSFVVLSVSEPPLKRTKDN